MHSIQIRNSSQETTEYMVIDQLKNAALYMGLGERIAAALRYLQDTDCTALAPGKIAIQGDQIYALVQDNTTKPRAEGIWEAHRKFIDVQYVAAGCEEMGWTSIDQLTVRKPYDEAADFALFDGAGSFVQVPAGSFAIFFPQDAHIPGSAVNDIPSAVRKIVVKVAV